MVSGVRFSSSSARWVVRRVRVRLMAAPETSAAAGRKPTFSPGSAIPTTPPATPTPPAMLGNTPWTSSPTSTTPTPNTVRAKLHALNQAPEGTEEQGYGEHHERGGAR